MSKIKLESLYIKALHHSEFGQLMLRLSEDINASDIDLNDDLSFKKMYDDLLEQVSIYNSALKQVRGSEDSESIAKLDTVRDWDIQALRDSVKPYRHGKTPNENEAYRKLQILLSNYKNIEDESYEAETNLVNNLVEKLQSSEYVNAVSELNIEKFVIRLSDSNTAFNALFGRRSFKTSQKITVDVKALRKTISDQYKTLINYIIAMCSVKDGDYYQDILAVINIGRHYYSKVVLAKRVAKQSD